MQHVRIFATFFGFPVCLKAEDVTDEQAVATQAFIAALAAVVPFLGPFLSVQLTPEAPATPAVTVADVTTAPAE